MKKINLKKFFALLSATFMLATCAACSCDSGYLNGSDSPSASNTTSDTTPDQSDTATPIALQTPMHLSFDEENFILTWEGVDNAVCYLVDHNGAIYETYGTESVFFLTETDNTFKVQAVGDGINYTNSDWSMEYYYQLPPQQSTYEKVKSKIAETAEKENLKLEKLIGVTYVNLNPNTTASNIDFCVVCTDDKNVSSMYFFYFVHENPLSLGTMLETFELATYQGKKKYKTVVDYQSAEYLVEGKDYVGIMQEYHQRGFEISVVQSVALEGTKVGSKFRFEIFGTFKAQSGNTIEYFTAWYSIDILIPSPKDNYNYEVFVFSEEYRTLAEYRYIQYEDYQSLEYINAWAAENDPNYKSEE